jgi:hypothetical protein
MQPIFQKFHVMFNIVISHLIDVLNLNLLISQYIIVKLLQTYEHV